MVQADWLLVTGSAVRLGREVALAAAGNGWNLLIHCHTSRDAAETTARDCRDLGVQAAVVQADLGDASAVETLFAQAMALSGGRITGLVNSASRFDWDDLSNASAEALHRHMDTNLFAPLLLARLLARHLPPDSSGSIVNVLDFKLRNPNPDHLTYSLSKYGLAGLTQILARQLAPRLRVNAVSPGYILPAPGQSEADFLDRSRQTPLQRPARWQDVVAGILFLLETPSVTGQNLTIDCGVSFSTLPRDIAY